MSRSDMALRLTGSEIVKILSHLHSAAGVSPAEVKGVSLPLNIIVLQYM